MKLASERIAAHGHQFVGDERIQQTLNNINADFDADTSIHTITYEVKDSSHMYQVTQILRMCGYTVTWPNLYTIHVSWLPNNRKYDIL